MLRLLPVRVLAVVVAGLAAVAVLGAASAPWLTARAMAQGHADVRGEWVGAYTVGGGDFPHDWSITDEDFTTGEVTGTAIGGSYSLQGTVRGSSFQFELRVIAGGYVAFSEGTVSADGQTISGLMTSDSNGRSGTFEVRRKDGGGSGSTPDGGGGTSGDGSGGAGDADAVGPAALEYVLPGPFDLSYAPADVARSVGIMALVMLLIGAPTPIFNSTLSANRALIERWARRRRPGWLRRLLDGAGAGPAGARAPSVGERIASVSRTWQGLAAYLLLATLVYAFLDAAFPFPDGPRVFITTLLGIGIGTAVSQLPGEWYVRTRHGGRGAVNVALWTIAIAAACVVITRVTGFQPGYVYGIIGGFTFTVALSREDRGRMATLGMAFLLITGLVAWFARIPFQPGASLGGGPGAFIGQVFAGVFIAAVQGAVVALIPLRFLDGHRLASWDRRAWALMWGASLLLFAHVLLYPVSSFTPDPSGTGLITVLAVALAYTLVALTFWASFEGRDRRRERRRARASIASAAPLS